MTPPALQYKSGIISTFLSSRILCAFGVIGPLAPSEMTFAFDYRIKDVITFLGTISLYSDWSVSFYNYGRAGKVAIGSKRAK